MDDQQQWYQDMKSFFATMAQQVERNMYKGGQEAWLQVNWEQYLTELQMNIQELRLAITYGVSVEEKAADVAVDAFIIANIWHRNAGITPGIIAPTVTNG